MATKAQEGLIHDGPQQSRAGRSSRMIWACAWLFVVVLSAMSLYELRTPRVVPANAPADQFSAERAFVHVRAISQAPHYIGTEANHRVRDYIVQELNKLGLKPEVQSATAMRHFFGRLIAGRVENIVVRIPGTANTRAIMLGGHYDTVDHAPGACDDAAAVATMLETLRVLRTGPPLQNDLVLLFNDGEEVGLLGSEAFTNSHPWAKDIAVVFNLEARGGSGQSVMFEATHPSTWLIREFAAGAPFPVGNSFAEAWASLLPDDSDMTVFRKTGMAGLNFAFLDDFENGHTRLDTPERLDLRSLQHHGSYAVGLVRHFGSLDLNPHPQGGDSIYFNIIGSIFVSYPVWLGGCVLLAAIIATLLMLWIGTKRKELTAGKTFLSALCALFMAPATAGLCYLLWKILSPVLGPRLPMGTTLGNDLLLVSLVSFGLAIVVAGCAGLVRRLGATNAAAGGLIAACILTAAATLLVPGASYFLLWQLVCSVVVFGLVIAGSSSQRIAAVCILGAGPALLLAPPLIYNALVLFDPTPLLAISVGLMIGIVAATNLPFVTLLGGRRRAAVPIALLAISFATFLVAKRLTVFTPDSPRPDSLAYSYNADLHKAVWLSYDSVPDEWTSKFVGAKPTVSPRPDYLIGFNGPVSWAEAPIMELAPPRLGVISDTSTGSTRTLEMKLESPRNANVLALHLEGEGELVSITADGRTDDSHVPLTRGFDLRFYAPPAGGVILRMVINDAGKIHARLEDRSLGLPPLDILNKFSRPPDTMAFSGSDLTLVDTQLDLH